MNYIKENFLKVFRDERMRSILMVSLITSDAPNSEEDILNYIQSIDNYINIIRYEITEQELPNKQEILNSLINCLKIRLKDYEDIIKEGLDNAKSGQNS